jgi:anti-sigma28 factor (negative regulator of flagellin synthesis)
MAPRHLTRAAARSTLGSVAANQRTRNQTRVSAERQAKLDRIREQIESGQLRVRQASAAERRQWQREREQRNDS